MCIFSTIHSCSAKRVVRIFFVQPVIFIQNRYARCFDGRNAAEQIPQALEMILHLSAASHHITAGRIKDTVTGPSGDIHCFQNVDMGSFHLPVSYQKAGCCQRCQSASDNVSIFAIDTFRFFRSCKSFVVTVAVINTFAVLFIFSTLGIAVIFSLLFSFFAYLFLFILIFFCFLTQKHRCSGSGCCCHRIF